MHTMSPEREEKVNKSDSRLMEPYFVDVPTASRLLGIGLTTTWGLVKSGKLDSLKVGGRSRRVTMESIRRFAKEQAAAAGVQILADGEASHA
jgi:excisionase family DNA binding protein